MIGLFLIDSFVAAAAVALFGTTYVALAFTARRELKTNSKKIANASGQQLKALQEGLGAIRDVLLDGTQDSYLSIYQKADWPLRRLQAKNTFIGAFPRFAFEAFGIVAIASLGGWRVFQLGNGDAVIPLLGALALGGQRLLPALQQIYSCWAALNGYHFALQDVLDMLNQPLPPLILQNQPLTFRDKIQLSDVSFRYGLKEPEVLSSINLKIFRGESIGIIGATGSGKSTLINLLMGLIPPTSGNVCVDLIDIHDVKYPGRLPSWRSMIAHVPQSIFLVDGSIAENIAFGSPQEKIDMGRVRKAAEQAQILEFVDSIPEGFSTKVGERGIRLSGGQRQRIGIARALYKKAQILVFDEATSALDRFTEISVMNSIKALQSGLTIVMVAHRISTVEACDRVIKIENGRLESDGPPDVVLDLQ